MNSFKKLLSVFLVFAMVLSMTAAMTGCKRRGSSESTGGNDDNGTKGNYTVSVQTAGGMAMDGIAVYVYADSSLEPEYQYVSFNHDCTD